MNAAAPALAQHIELGQETGDAVIELVLII